jgi:hypothetical protein
MVDFVAPRTGRAGIADNAPPPSAALG